MADAPVLIFAPSTAAAVAVAVVAIPNIDWAAERDGWIDSRLG